jgi:hypothetical protein
MRWLLLAAVTCVWTGCGYVGDPLPPALNIPQPVADLRVIQRGDKLILDFTAPTLTTEAIGLTSITAAEAQIGKTAMILQTPKPGEPAHIELPAGEWVKQEVTVHVVLSGPKGRKSAASNSVTLRVTEPLRPPEGIKAELHPEGVRLSWPVTGDAVTKYRIIRNPDASAVVERPEYIDNTVELGKEYSYSVVKLGEGVESLPSTPVSIVPRDIFAPPIPASLNAIAGVDTVELAWERSVAPDLKGYRIYRDGQALGETEAPSFSDKQLKSGQSYRYELTAIDQAGNESARSSPVEVVAP